MLPRRLIFISLLVFAQAKAQNTIALPDIVNYSKQTYNAGPANWGICQDKKGIIYVANDEGLLTFDGSFWKRYSTPSSAVIRALAFAPDGKLYIGSSGEIGFFEPDANGLLRFTSLNNMIPDSEKDFTEVWNVVVHGDAVYFRSYKRIFELRNNKITVYKGLSWSFLGSSNGRLISKAFGKGLLSFQNDQWKPFLEGDTLPEKAQVVGVLPLNKDSSLLLTKKHGAYVLHGNLLLPFHTADLETICEKNPYSVSYIDNDRIAIGTSLGGCFIINRKGQFIQRLAKQDGLQGNDIISVFVDREKNLWLGLSNGIDFIAYNNAIRHIYPDYQEHSGGKSAAVFDNDLYIGTSNGLYRAPIGDQTDLGYVKTNFEPIPNTQGQVWSLCEVNGELIIGHNDGFFVLKNHSLQVIDGTTGFWTFLPLGNIMPSPVILAGTYNGVNFYNYEKGVFKNPSIHSHFESVRFIAVDNDIAWVCHPSKGLYKVQLNNGVNPGYSVYKDSKGILSENRNYVFKLKSRIIFTSDKGIFEYDDKSDDFIPCTFLRNIFGDIHVEYLKEDNDGNIWFIENKRLGVVDFSQKDPQIIHFPELKNKIMAGGFEFVYPYNRNNIFVAAEEGFYLINYEQYRARKEDIPVLINTVKINNKKDSIIFGGYSNDISTDSVINKSIPEIRYRWNSIHFEYSSSLYGKQSSIEYSYYLDGFDNRWSPWSKKTEKEYLYLSPGSYTFKVKARTHEGEESATLNYRFIILPPWYRTTWMYLFYAVLIGFGIYGIHRLQRKKFIRQQQQHEEERNKLEYVNKLQREKFEEEQKQLTYLHQLELERNENEIIRLRNEKLEAEIQLKNTELASTTLNLIQKGEMLVKVKEEFVRMKKVSEVDKDSDDYKKILKMLGDDKMKKNWEQFAVHFDKVHSDFLVSIKAAYPNLTPSELKLCAYLRLSLSSKEIAQIMNITMKSVELGRHRLRKKLGISPNVNLFNFLLNFHSEIHSNKNGH
jgi:ligand-binding sensor domain-containing protein/DNA-binding CsgD family transcriptional regulator